MRRVRSVLLLAGVMLVVACGSPFDIDHATVGMYTLATVDGGALPAVLSESAGTTVEVLSGSIHLIDGGEATGSHTYRTTVDGASSMETQPEAGTWALVAGTVNVFWNSGDFEPFVYTGSTIEVLRDGRRFVYAR